MVSEQLILEQMMLEYREFSRSMRTSFQDLRELCVSMQTNLHELKEELRKEEEANAESKLNPESGSDLQQKVNTNFESGIEIAMDEVRSELSSGSDSSPSLHSNEDPLSISSSSKPSDREGYLDSNMKLNPKSDSDLNQKVDTKLDPVVNLEEDMDFDEEIAIEVEVIEEPQLMSISSPIVQSAIQISPSPSLLCSFKALSLKLLWCPSGLSNLTETEELTINESMFMMHRRSKVYQVTTNFVINESRTLKLEVSRGPCSSKSEEEIRANSYGFSSLNPNLDLDPDPPDVYHQLFNNSWPMSFSLCTSPTEISTGYNEGWPIPLTAHRMALSSGPTKYSVKRREEVDRHIIEDRLKNSQWIANDCLEWPSHVSLKVFFYHVFINEEENQLNIMKRRWNMEAKAEVVTDFESHHLLSCQGGVGGKDEKFLVIVVEFLHNFYENVDEYYELKVVEKEKDLIGSKLIFPLYVSSGKIFRNKSVDQIHVAMTEVRKQSVVSLYRTMKRAEDKKGVNKTSFSNKYKNSAWFSKLIGIRLGMYVEVVQDGQVSLTPIVGLSERMKLEGVGRQKVVVLMGNGELYSLGITVAEKLSFITPIHLIPEEINEQITFFKDYGVADNFILKKLLSKMKPLTKVINAYGNTWELGVAVTIEEGIFPGVRVMGHTGSSGRIDTARLQSGTNSSCHFIDVGRMIKNDISCTTVPVDGISKKESNVSYDPISLALVKELDMVSMCGRLGDAHPKPRHHYHLHQHR